MFCPRVFKKCRALLGAKVRKGAGIYKSKCFVPACSRSAGHFLGRKLLKLKTTNKQMLSPMILIVKSYNKAYQYNILQSHGNSL